VIVGLVMIFIMVFVVIAVLVITDVPLVVLFRGSWLTVTGECSPASSVQIEGLG
jgi:hypothetical protein